MKNIKGITLVALVITIVVLLILGGITINEVFNDNGIVRQAIKTKIYQHNAEIQDVIVIKIADIELTDEISKNKHSFNERKDEVYEELNKAKLLYDTQIVENMIIAHKKYPIFLTNTEKPIELDKNLYDYQINSDSTAKITKYKGNEEKIVIPQYIIENDKAYIITTIGEQCFANNQSIVEIEIPENIVEIQNWAFEKSNNIKKISMSDSVKKLERYGCFGNLEKLEEIILSENITTITQYTFMNDSNLKKIHIPNSVTTIDEGAFMNCYRLEELIMPSSLETIGTSAFENVSFSGYGDGIKRIVLNEGLKTIGAKAFRHCHNIKEDLILPSTITNIGELAFEDFGYISGKKVYYSDGTEY